MEWDKIWAMNKKIIDPIAPRFTTVDKSYNVPVTIKDVKVESVEADKHPKDPAIGKKTVWRGPLVYIDGADAENLKEGENTTFVNWGNIVIDKVVKSNGKVTSVEATPNLTNMDFKKTLKLTWLAKVNDTKADFTPTVCIHYDHIISKPVLEKTDEFKDFVAKDTETRIEMLGDPELKNLKKGEVIQIQRRGFFIVDRPYGGISPNTCKPYPIHLIAIPDGTPGSYGAPGKKVEAAAPASKKSVKDDKKKDSKSAAKNEPKKKEATPPKSAESASSGGWSTKAVQLNDDIAAQGDKVRQLKTDKANKEAIKTAVDVLLGLKNKFKSETGQDWKPGMKNPGAGAASNPASNDADALNSQIADQGNKVRDLKGKKAEKSDIDAAVATLLDLKAKYKAATGKDWKPGAHKSSSPPKETGGSSANAGDKLSEEITAQGNKIRDLKSKKAEKLEIDGAVALLLDLKAKYKAAVGKDWKPGTHKASTPPKESIPASASNNEGDKLNDGIAAQGNKVRDLKGKKAEKSEIDSAVAVLLDLKAKYKAAVGKDWKPGAHKSSTPPKESTPASGSNDEGAKLNESITAQGNKVRDLKGKKADKAEIDSAVANLLDLKVC